MKPRVLIPIALGTNRDGDLAQAFELAGAEASQVPLSVLRAGEEKLSDYQILAMPGGFSYGDALGAGRLLGLDLADWMGDQLKEAKAAGKPMIGICNGFQALVSAGVLPGAGAQATLTDNANSKFECRWVTLAPTSSRSVWTDGLNQPITCPVAHGEGRFVSEDLSKLEANDQVIFRYSAYDGSPAMGSYPENPNGSAGDVAGVCDETGTIIGLMPHPENHVMERQNPQRRRNPGGSCLGLFSSVVVAVAGS